MRPRGDVRGQLMVMGVPGIASRRYAVGLLVLVLTTTRQLAADDDGRAGTQVVGEASHEAASITAETVAGEWCGIAPDYDMLVTLQVDQGLKRTQLAIAEGSHGTIVTNTYTVQDLKVQDGRVVFGTRDGTMALYLEGWRHAGSGWARGTLALKAGRGATREVQVYFFYLRGTSWIRRMTQLHREAQP